MATAIGIDLGTTNSCVAAVVNGKTEIITNSSGERTTPSIVAFTKIGERLIGSAAKRQMVINPDRTISSIKRQMGTNWTTRIDGTEYKPQTISALILKQLKEDAESYLGAPVSDAVITVPAYFNDIQRQATKDAGKIAGLNVLRIINEPTSAAVSYGLDHGEPTKVLVYDFGGGTFDVSVIEIGEGVIEVLATSGDNHLGGDDIDNRLMDHLISLCRKQTGFDASKDFSARQRMKEAAENAKKELSTAEQVNINLPYLSQTKNGPVNFETVISRSEFNRLISDIIDRTEGPVRSALSDAGITPAQLGRVLLVGGSTRIPAVQDKVKMLTGKEPSHSINPDECVAAGAAILASQLTGNAIQVSNGNAGGLLLLDVIPMSLSIETMGGVATRLVERNSTLPIKYSRVFSTAGSFQREVVINVLQGERPMARDNKSIGKFTLKGIRRAPAGVPQIQVTFEIDTNGILNVSAVDLDTRAAQSIVITSGERMSDAEIRQAMADAAQYAGADETKRRGLELSEKINRLILETQTKLNNEKKTMDKEKIKDIKASLKKLEKAAGGFRLDKVTDAQINEMQAAYDELEAKIH